MQDIPTFPLLAHQQSTIGQLKNQIKAELAARQLDRLSIDSDVSSKSLFAIEYEKVPAISQLYDQSNMALPFNARIIDVLAFDEIVIPISFDIESTFN